MMPHHHVIESAELTDYDRARATGYLRLLDVVGVRAHWRDATDPIFGIFGIDSGIEETLTRQIFDANLARACCMISVVYKLLLASSRQDAKT